MVLGKSLICEMFSSLLLFLFPPFLPPSLSLAVSPRLSQIELCSTCWHQTHHPPASASWVLGLHAVFTFSKQMSKVVKHDYRDVCQDAVQEVVNISNCFLTQKKDNLGWWYGSSDRAPAYLSVRPWVQTPSMPLKKRWPVPYSGLEKNHISQSSRPRFSV
jgi:hypothetical protein